MLEFKHCSIFPNCSLANNKLKDRVTHRARVEGEKRERESHLAHQQACIPCACAWFISVSQSHSNSGVINNNLPTGPPSGCPACALVKLASVHLPPWQPVCIDNASQRFRRRDKSTWSVMISKRPSSQFSKSASSSRSSSRQPSSQGSWDADDDRSTMSTTEEEPQPLSVSIPHATGPYCPRRPNLHEILAGTAPAPYTLPSFMAFLSSNLCLENLEFTMDAGRYAKHYAKMLSKAGPGAEPAAKDRDYVKLLWVRLIDAYIAPNGSREVNLPSNVRDPILSAATEPMPPAPQTLDLAVRKIYELMDESVLGPFLNSCAEAEAAASWQNRQTTTVSAPAHEDHGPRFHMTRKSRESSPPHNSADGHNSSGMYRMTHPKSLFSSKHSTALVTSNSNTSDPNLTTSWSGPGMTDDSGSTGSPTNESPMTPPLSPPSSDLPSSLSSSPKHGRDNGMWKKLGRLSGMGKKKSSHHEP